MNMNFVVNTILHIHIRMNSKEVNVNFISGKGKIPCKLGLVQKDSCKCFLHGAIPRIEKDSVT